MMKLCVICCKNLFLFFKYLLDGQIVIGISFPPYFHNSVTQSLFSNLELKGDARVLVSFCLFFLGCQNGLQSNWMCRCVLLWFDFYVDVENQNSKPHYKWCFWEKCWSDIIPMRIVLFLKDWVHRWFSNMNHHAWFLGLPLRDCISW